MSEEAVVKIEAPARVHFGVLDLGGSLGRRFGGIGAAIADPSLKISARRAADFRSDGSDSDRVLTAARRMAAFHRLSGGAHFTLHRAIPAHAGLGSGTQLALSVGRLLAELYDLPSDPVSLAEATGRGARSAIGTWAFARGGFILEGGRHPAESRIAPLLASVPMPADWRYVVAVPTVAPGLSGELEAEAFRTLPAPPAEEAAQVAHLVLMRLLPALVEARLPEFGAALREVQQMNGRWFAPSQGGVFAPGPTSRIVDRLAQLGACGVGQSSWGPTAYGIAPDQAAAFRIGTGIGRMLGSGGRVFIGPFAASGARIIVGDEGERPD